MTRATPGLLAATRHGIQSWLVALLLLTCLSPASAKPVVLPESADADLAIRLGPALELLRDEGTELTIQRVSQANMNDLFKPSAVPKPSFGFIQDAIWSRFSLHNPGATTQTWYLELANPRLQQVDLYLQRQAIMAEHRSTGTRYPFSHRELRYVYPVFRLDIAAGETLELYLRTASETAHFLPLTLRTDYNMKRTTVRAYGYAGLFIGLLLILLVYNLAQMLIANERSYLYYVLYLGTGILYDLTITGFGYQFLWPDNPWWAHRSGNIVGILSALTGIIFAVKFLNTRIRHPRIYRFFHVSCIGLFALFCLSFFVDYQSISKITVPVGMIYPPLVLGICILSWRSGDRGAGYLSIVFAIATLGVVAWTMRLLGMVPDTELTAGILRAAIVVEFLLLNLAMVDKINQIRLEQENTLEDKLQESGRLAELNRATERFIPVEALEMLGREDLRQVVLGDQVEARMTVLFVDIQSLNAQLSGLPPAQHFEFLNQYFSLVEPLIQSHDGFIGRYIGDAMLCLFPRQADDAVHAALGMLNEMNLFMEAYGGVTHGPLSLRVGINTGYLRLGTVGEPDRLEIAVLGDGANLAARVQSACENYDASLLITGETRRALADVSAFNMRLVDTLQPRGRLETVTLYEVYDADWSELREGKLATRESFEAAILAYRQGDLAAADRQLRVVLARNPGDHLAMRYLSRIGLEIRIQSHRRMTPQAT